MNDKKFKLIMIFFVCIAGCTGKTGPQGPVGPTGAESFPTLTANIASGCMTEPNVGASAYSVVLGQNYGECPRALNCSFTCFSNIDCTDEKTCGVSPITQTLALPMTNCNLIIFGLYTNFMFTTCAGGGSPCGSVGISCS